METQFVGSLVSVDCGEVLGIYQGCLDSIDQSKQILTIVNAFHNGTRCLVPRISINATDICDLKIIKDAKLSMTAPGQQHSKRASDGQILANAHQYDRQFGPEAHDGSIVLFQHSTSGVPLTNTRNNVNSKEPNIAQGFKSVTAASPRKTSVKAASRASNCKKSQNVVSADSRSSPYKKQTNGLLQKRQLNGTSRIKSYDTGQLDGCSPNDLSTCVQALTVSDEMVKSTDCFPETNQRNLSRNRTTSASDASLIRNGWKSPGSRHGVRGPGIFKEEDCFAVSVDSFLDDDFDFEKNLALFDKRAVFDKIERQRELAGSTTPTFCAAAGCSSPRPADAKYRCDENVLPRSKAVYRQILVSNATDVVISCEYVTDSGLVVPSVEPALRNRLITAAMRNGFDQGRLIEMVGRSAAEMVLQLLGGGNRFDPKNMHQCPQVVVLCGSGSQATFAMNCARHLASRRIHLTVFIPDSVGFSDAMDMEMKLLDLSGAKLKTSNYNSLPTSPVDIIVSALDSDDVDLSSEAWYQSVVAWANSNKAPVLCVDPPTENVGVVAKWSLAVALPLAYSDRCGQIYLCDLGLPARLYREAGLKTYESPFAHKFVIPLHLP